jgi:hypothetical protein
MRPALLTFLFRPVGSPWAPLQSCVWTRDSARRLPQLLLAWLDCSSTLKTVAALFSELSVSRCWSSPAQSVLVSAPIGTHYDIFVLYKIFCAPKWTSSSTRGGVWILVDTHPLLGNDSSRHSLTDWLLPKHKVTHLFVKDPKSKLCYELRSVVLVPITHLGPKTRFLLLSDSCGFVNVGRPLWREERSVVYNSYWTSPAQSFSGPSPAGLD